MNDMKDLYLAENLEQMISGMETYLNLVEKMAGEGRRSCIVVLPKRSNIPSGSQVNGTGDLQRRNVFAA